MQHSNTFLSNKCDNFVMICIIHSCKATFELWVFFWWPSARIWIWQALWDCQQANLLVLVTVIYHFEILHLLDCFKWYWSCWAMIYKNQCTILLKALAFNDTVPNKVKLFWIDTKTSVHMSLWFEMNGLIPSNPPTQDQWHHPS